MPKKVCFAKKLAKAYGLHNEFFYVTCASGCGLKDHSSHGVKKKIAGIATMPLFLVASKPF